VQKRSSRLSPNWDLTPEERDDYEYVPLRLPPDVSRVSASMRIAIQAEFGGWELSRVRLYNDGSRRVLLKRRKTERPIPEPGI